MLCLAHRRLGPADLVHRSSSPWSAALSSAPWAKGQGPGKTEQLPEVTAKKISRADFSLEQANERIHLPAPPLPQSTNPIYCGTRDKTKGKILGRGAGEANPAPEILAPFLGAVCSVSQHLQEQFPELKLPGVLILPLPVHLCPEGPFQMDTNCGGCTLLAAPMPQGPEDLLLKALIDKDLSVFRSSWSRALAHQCNLNAASLAPRRMRVNVVKMKEDL